MRKRCSSADQINDSLSALQHSSTAARQNFCFLSCFVDLSPRPIYN